MIFGIFRNTSLFIISISIDNFPNIKNVWSRYITLHLRLTPWLMEPGGPIPHSQGLSNNPYPELNQPESTGAGGTTTQA